MERKGISKEVHTRSPTPTTGAEIRSENQRKINNFTGLISKKITNLHDQLNKLDKEIEANTAKINANSKASQDKINEYNKQRAQLKKKMAAARHGAVPPPWPGPRPPPSMMPVPIQ